jgi:hypothetical protein
MSWISIIFYIIMNLPKFIAIIRQIIDLIPKKTASERGTILEMLREAIEHHKATGDDSKLQHVCDGIVGCEAQIKH